MNLFKRMFPTIINATYDSNIKILTITYSNTDVELYYGENTVWFHYPMMKRMGTMAEKKLHEIITYIRIHGNPYPTSHLKTKI